ncbi:hypothetical protein BH23ACT5_BH23ACT5_13330 [soil metagenome]
MLAWNLAAVFVLFRRIFRDPKVDMRFLAVGVILPDLVDLAIVTSVGGPTGELWAHSLLVPTVLAVGVLLATRRGRRRRAWMALVVGWLLHLLVDGLWTDATVFLWPAFGLEMELGGEAFWPAAWQRAIADPWRWVREVIGLAYLVWLWRVSKLHSPDRRAALIRTGRLGDTTSVSSP